MAKNVTDIGDYKNRHSKDGTVRLLVEHGIPVTRENYIRLASLGSVNPDEPLDGELEAELPEELQIHDAE